MRGNEQSKAQGLRLAMLIDQWEQSGNRVRVRCARDVRNALDADDVLGAFVHVLDKGKHRTELDELRALVRVVETMDLGGYTQRDADAVAVALWSAGYRRVDQIE
jgi:hypothetical protein